MPTFKIEINRFIGQPEECEPSRHPPATRKLIQAFLDAGFVALGIKRERAEGRPVRDGMAFANAAELLEVHRASVAKMEKKGHVVYARFDRDARIESVRQYYENPDV